MTATNPPAGRVVPPAGPVVRPAGPVVRPAGPVVRPAGPVVPPAGPVVPSADTAVKAPGVVALEASGGTTARARLLRMIRQFVLGASVLSPYAWYEDPDAEPRTVPMPWLW
jgi:hypothetical protein